MITIEERLRATLTEGSEHLELPARVARNAWKRGRRRHHQLVAVSAGIGLAAAAVTTAGIVGVESAPHQRVGTTPSAVVTSAPTARSAPPTGTATAACPATEMIGSIPHPDAVLEAICLPDPAPGFPMRTSPNTTAMAQGGLIRNNALTHTFWVEVTPEVKTVQPGGSTLSVPTGPQATVEVARSGAFPTTPAGIEASPAATDYPVIGTTTALGATATIVSTGDGEIGVLASARGFDIAAYGSNWKSTPPVTPAQLVALIDSLQGLPGN